MTPRPAPANLISDDLEIEIREKRKLLSVAPSKMGTDFWYGEWVNDQRFTWRQIKHLRSIGMAVESAEELIVYVSCSDMVWTPMGQKTPHRTIPCPIVGRRADQLKVVAPNGECKLVWPDGWLTKPRDQRRRMPGMGR